jgi:ADP-ribosylglycohydrolase
MDRSTLLNHVKGMFFGGAIGDALGYPAEFDHKVDPRQRKYNDLLLNKDDIALVTDDTLMTMAVARGLIRAFEEELAYESYDSGAAASFVAEEIKDWYADPTQQTSQRGSGSSCLAGGRKLVDGVHWSIAGKIDGRGCGAAMRSAPYGLWGKFGWVWAERHARMTHIHEEAEVAAAVVAKAAASILEGIILKEPTPDVAYNVLIDTIDVASGDILGLLEQLFEVNTPKFLEEHKEFLAADVVASAIMCFLRHPDDYREAVLMAANTPGDSDSIAAITGNLVGLLVGYDKLPKEWVVRIEFFHELEQLAEDFTTAIFRVNKYNETT